MKKSEIKNDIMTIELIEDEDEEEEEVV